MKELQWLLENGWLVMGFEWSDASNTYQHFDWRREDRRVDLTFSLAKNNELDTITLDLKWLEEPVAYEIINLAATCRRG